jgi:sarcosine oxidase
MSSPDVIVLGLGGMGTAAAWQLARRGLRVLGLEQFRIGHDQGSSHGHTRIIRQAYYEHPDYVPLVRRSFEGWYELEQRQGVHLLTSCPCLTLGPPDGELVTGVRRSAAEHALPVEVLSLNEVSRRHPAFRFAPECDMVGVVEHTAGFLYVDRCVVSMAEEARRLGATLLDGEAVVGWEAVSGGIVVHTTAGRHTAAKLVITAGPWAGRMLGALGVSLRVMRQVVFWMNMTDDSAFRRDQFPIFIADTPGGYFYGMPALDRRGVKVAQHYGAEELSGPESINRTITPADEEPVRGFVRAYLPGADREVGGSSVCIYTLTPDRHFLIDRLPGTECVSVAAGFSGHGFKFAPVVGEILADLVVFGQTQQPIELFRIGRFAREEQEAKP